MGITLDTATPITSVGGGGSGKSTASGSHLLQIDGYSIAKQAPNGTSLKSCPFTVGGHAWILHLFPNGACRESAGFISVFIGLHEHADQWRRVSLQVEFSFVGEVGKQDPAHVRARQELEPFFNYGVGYSRFIAREALERSKHLRGDRFTVRCDLFVGGYDARGRTRCMACNDRPLTVGRVPLIHACFCDVCNDASRNGSTAKHCAGCHGPYDGRCLIPPVLFDVVR